MKPRNGFTLVELMITVAIVAILASIAYPSYTNYVIRANRSAAQQFMLDVANREEQYRLDARQYVSAADNAAFSGALKMAVPPEVSAKYDVSVVADNAATPPLFTITAVPKGSQAGDGNLTLDNRNNKSPADKWK